MANHGGHTRWCRDNAVVMHVAQHPAQQGGHNNRHQNCSVNITRGQNRNDKEAQHAQQYAVRGQVADAHQGILVRDDDTGVFQTHHADEQTDTAGDTHAQAHRDIGNHPVTHAENGQQQQADSAPEDSAHSHLPRQAHRLHNHEGEEGVQTHCRCQSNRKVCEHAH
ncbi:hypothetical protein D3C76_1101530 [compost metagenome]